MRDLPTQWSSSNEVLFRVTNKNKVLRNNENLKIDIVPNSLLDWTSLYVLTVSLKEQILYSEQFQFDEKPKTKSITVRDDQMDIPNGGTLQVNLYKLSDGIIAYAEYLNDVGYDYDANNTNVEGGSTGWWPGGGGIDGIVDVAPADPVKDPEGGKVDEGGRNLKKQRDDKIVEEILQGENEDLKKSSLKKQSEAKMIAPNDTRPDIYQWREYKGEILVFKEPEDKLKLTIKTKQAIYKPGDLVEFEVTMTDGSLLGDQNVETLVNVVVTDDSVFQRLEEKLQPPTFASAMYLAYDVLNYNYHFNYANNYLEHFFVDSKVDYSSDLNLELLLATQTWRGGIFDLPMVREVQNNYYSMEKEDQQRITNLFGGGFYQMYYSLEMVEDVVYMAGDGSPPVKNDDKSDEDLATTSSSSTTGSEDPLAELPTDYMTGIKSDTKYWAH
mmetsp:Transcript_19520/g.14211  ORF Transcript_19520/g.14211 Transcript_19520/m.14211 type:complete len:441 (-) Transcript_19520:1937-3259(-)